MWVNDGNHRRRRLTGRPRLDVGPGSEFEDWPDIAQDTLNADSNMTRASRPVRLAAIE